MSNEKLIDAIGMLDDEMIYEAKFGKVKHFPHIAKVIAAALIIMIIPMAVIGAFNMLGHMGTDGVYPNTKYSFRNEKLMKICNINITYESYEPTPDLKLTMQYIGSEICGVEYADDEKVVFTSRTGIFVYNYKSDNIVYTFDLEKIGVPAFNQGDDSYSILQVDKSGRYAILKSTDNSGNKYHYINLLNGEVKDIAENDIPEDMESIETQEMTYYPESDSDDSFNYYSPKAHTSSYMANYHNCNFFMCIEPDNKGKLLVGNMELLIVKPDGSFTTQRVFADMFPKIRK